MRPTTEDILQGRQDPKSEMLYIKPLESLLVIVSYMMIIYIVLLIVLALSNIMQ